MTTSTVDPPEEVPAEVAEAFDRCSDRQLREIIHYAQQLLRDHPPLTDAIESREGEELVRTEDHGEYTLVVVERPDGADGQFAYRVKWETNVDGEGQYRWHYLGQVVGE